VGETRGFPYIVVIGVDIPHGTYKIAKESAKKMMDEIMDTLTTPREELEKIFYRRWL